MKCSNNAKGWSSLGPKHKQVGTPATEAQGDKHAQTALCLCLYLCRPRSHWSKLRHQHVLMLMSLVFSLTYACACEYAYVLVKTSP